MKAMQLVVRRPKPFSCITNRIASADAILLREVIHQPARQPRRPQVANAVSAAPTANPGIRGASNRREDGPECRAGFARKVAELLQIEFRCPRQAMRNPQACESRFRAPIYFQSRHKRIEAAAFLYQLANPQRCSMPSQ